MTIIKLGEAVTITPDAIQSQESVMSNPAILERFEKIAADLKVIAPRAKDFLYFSAIMMHAAESVLLNDDGTIKKDANGEEINAHWEKKGDSWKWVCSDPNMQPYKNSNNDIFPEEELLKAYKKWIGRPLCLDHKSSSVDMVRGVIVDTYYDYPKKRIIALCALDKVNYPDLARKVSTGYATSVSMGTAVGRAICSECGKVARTENDFCPHMRQKSCYGEINCDLNPIELSIVVSGADGKAKIRHIVAAAHSIAQYVDSKEELISKLADMNELVDPEAVAEIKKDLERACEKLEALEQKAETVEEAEEGEEMSQEKQEADDVCEAPIETKEEKDASTDVELGKFASVVNGIHTSLNKLQNDVDSLLSQNQNEGKMTEKKAYFQGGGGVNEPTPGAPKYPKEDYQGTRDNEDKQMVGQMDTGPVDGMAPGPDSAGESEVERKKRLQRLAEEEERAMRRQAAVEKAKEALKTRKAYFQGGGEGNEPTPGKPTYPKEDYQTTRDKEDKQMVGEAPFPDVGDVEGLYGDDEARKKMLLRAKLTAKFIKAAKSDGTEDPANSRWQVYADDKLILSSTVQEITDGKVEAFYDFVATEKYGRKILDVLRSEGFEKADAMLKSAQLTPPPAPPAPATAEEPVAPEELGAAPEALEPEGEPVPDEGGTGDPKEELPGLLNELENNVSDVREAVEALLEEGEELDEFGGIAEEVEAEGEGPGEGALPPVGAMVKMHKKLGKSLVVGMKKVGADMAEHIEELRLAEHIYKNEKKLDEKDASSVNTLVKDACDDAKSTIADCYKLMEAFVKYARGAEMLTKKSKQTKEQLKKKAEDACEECGDDKCECATADAADAADAADTADAADVDVADADVVLEEDVITPSPEFLKEIEKEVDAELEAPVNAPGSAEFYGALEEDEAAPAEPVESTTAYPLGGIDVGPTPERPAKLEYKPKEVYPMVGKGFGADDDDNAATAATLGPDGSLKVEGPTPDDLAKMTGASEKFDLTTKEGRVAYREELSKMAQQGLTFSNVLDEAHPGGGVTTQLDVAPTGELGKVETLEEAHDKVMDVATAPPRVRKMAEEIQQMVTAGKIDPEKDFDGLVAHGLDAEAVSYWKQYYGEGDAECSQFASELTKEHESQKLAEKQESYKVKIARAYELAHDMVDRGMLVRTAVNEQVKELMSFNDEAFNSMKRWVSTQTPMKKQASIPQVGMMGTGDSITLPEPEAAASDLQTELNKIWAGRKV